ncbi:MAG TPA: helix-turn-helix domain-containing protein [Solirubrobacterales bacterium]|nr:helix-turn-helix domain-containing protein [Solirubrobacterales bacterium]
MSGPVTLSVREEVDAFYTYATLARRWQVSERHIRDLMDEQKEEEPLPSFTFGTSRRFDPEEVDSWLKRRRERRGE